MNIPPAVFIAFCRAKRIPPPEPEYRFAPDRRWRFDYAWPDKFVALEVEGGAFTRGRHTRGAGFVKDLEKYSEAAVRGWCVIRCTPTQLTSDRVVDWLQRALIRIPIRRRAA